MDSYGPFNLNCYLTIQKRQVSAIAGHPGLQLCPRWGLDGAEVSWKHGRGCARWKTRRRGEDHLLFSNLVLIIFSALQLSKRFLKRKKLLLSFFLCLLAVCRFWLIVRQVTLTTTTLESRPQYCRQLLLLLLLHQALSHHYHHYHHHQRTPRE